VIDRSEDRGEYMWENTMIDKHVYETEAGEGEKDRMRRVLALPERASGAAGGCDRR
jgi:hypothetical protein